MGLGNAQFSALPLDGQFLGRRMGPPTPLGRGSEGPECPPSTVSCLAQGGVTDAEMVGDLVNHGGTHFADDVRPGSADRLNGLPEDGYAIRQHHIVVASLSERYALI